MNKIRDLISHPLEVITTDFERIIPKNRHHKDRSKNNIKKRKIRLDFLDLPFQRFLHYLAPTGND